MTLNAKDVTFVDGAEGLATETSLSLEQAIALVDVIDARAQHREHGQRDTVVVVDEEYSEWALEAETNVVLVKEMEDYVNKYGENKSFKVYGSACVNEAAWDYPDSTLTDALTTINETDKDFISEIGQTWIPKQYVEAIVAFK